MRFVHAFLLAAAIAAPVATLDAQAQTSGTRFGVAASYADHFNLGVGAFVKFHVAELSGHPITGRASFDYFFPGDYNVCDGPCTNNLTQHFWEISADGLYDIANANSNMKPYVGAGLALSHYSISDCDDCFDGTGGIGLNILGGLNFMANSKLMPFVEIKLGLGGTLGAYSGSVISLKGGLHF